MRFLDREWLRVVLLNVKQQLIKVAAVSQGSANESLAHPREVFKPALVLSAYSFILVHNLCGATHKLCYVENSVMCSLPTNCWYAERFFEELNASAAHK